MGTDVLLAAIKFDGTGKTQYHEMEIPLFLTTCVLTLHI